MRSARSSERRFVMDEPVFDAAALRHWCKWKRFLDADGRRRGVSWIARHRRAGSTVRATFECAEGHCEHWRLEVERAKGVAA